MSDPRFVHLRVHSDYSMSDGVAKVKPIIAAAESQGMAAIALTDQNNFCGLVKFYGACHGVGIKPIIGADFWVQTPGFEKEFCALTIIAMNNDGYQNLTQLISEAYLRGHIDNRVVIDQDWLIKYNSGLIILSGAKDGDVGKALLKGNQNQVESLIAFYQQHFEDRYYLELIRTGRAHEERYLHMAVELASIKGLPVVATNQVVFLKQDDFEAHEIRVAIHDGYTLVDPRRPKTYSDQQYLRTEDEMLALFSDIPSAIQNSVEIAKRCNVTIRLHEYFLPNFPTGDLSIEDFLVAASEKGLEERLAFLFPDPQVRIEKRGEYDERLAIELKVINQMGFPGYFLIVMEFIQWGKDNGIPVGPGRGSGAGSLVAYALKITDLDPLEYDLLFERFLNPERVSMPDFDVDFCMDRRDEVIDHVAELYGREAVSQIITFGTMAAKAVVRDVGRVLGHPYGFVERLTKMIPAEPGMTLAKAFEVEPSLPEAYDSDEDVKELIDMCRRLEGVTRNAGKHAGGVVIAPTRITDFAPLYCDAEGLNPVTQFDKNDVETAGLVKFDFLGLRTLTIIDWALQMINPRLAKEGKEPVLIEAIPLADPACFRLLQRYETTAVFQLESRGMKDLIKRLQPDCFEDMIALVALFRPGPLQSGMVDNFIERKHGREEVSYPDAEYQHESLKELLSPTYGIILYQEQVMQIAQVLSGYTLGGADMLRRAMGKKKPEEMAKQRGTFKEGAINNGIDGDLSMKIFDLVEKFAGYGFNKSHSAAYALVSYQTLWLKTHFPAQFMAAVMSADMDNTDKIVTLVDECERMGLPLIPPDVNKGQFKFTVDDDLNIVYGIGAIKGVGEGPVESILEARKDGPFIDLFDFCARVDLKKLNKRVIEKLILAGALDTLGPHRASMMATLPEAISAAAQHAKAEAIGQHDMFGLLNSEPEDSKQNFVQCTPWPDKIWLEGERETLGLYLTGHPINQYLKELKQYTNGRLKDIHPTERGKTVKVAGLVVATRVMITKRGSKMGLVTLDDKSARLEVMLFTEPFEKFGHMLEKDRILICEGDVSFDDFSGGNRMNARNIIEIGEARSHFAKAVAINVHGNDVTQAWLETFEQTLTPWRNGVVPVTINYAQDHASGKITLGDEWRVNPSDELMLALESMLGSTNVKIVF
ncbi:DNA polymerase III subunit alpha [Shewanella sp. SR43-4]|jgi:DNA polymerase-3 subunit alpha|uniref:DNA polymerase III subunit alpha n=2 Tax=Shewanellaceae TaxID=267890 RepID=UPI000C61BB57|nr:MULTISPECIES: DNA polymerase III subunit alpha [Shewanella]NCQ46195.1 DNA polymerase III subunit alpha [Shewanella frigidimarina]MBB1318279.1 DNA polymerase III subunit alpha [Shewanella sp. SR43-4]MBB1320045.1 DNA polymerase III subunit alpha [Shewanella sp. SR43-8]MBB1389286.1 DNA polymerase III subunit alpha [Shewanella sp. SG44-6]MBB1477379.1 DNA polymerase III subunit alpha [Shewanella sp. SG41-3]|tara:strand:- start:3989 stop:7462 length:3474 start_codon:yes stop_codon:yes gene_type:complete